MTSADARLTRPVAGMSALQSELRVLIAAEQEVLRAGIAALIRLQPGFAVAETRLDPTALVAASQSRRHDVLLVQVTPAACLSGLLHARSSGMVPRIAVVALLTEHLAHTDVLRSLVQQGVNGIVTADDKGPQLCDAMQAVRHGHHWLSPTVGGHLLEALVRPGTDRPRHHGGTSLSPPEHSVLALVAEGLTVCQIARRLHRSESAVKYHLSNMSARYQASNRAHLVYLAIRAGLLQVG